MKGHGALVALSKKCKEEQEWKTLDADEKAWLIAQLKKSKEKKACKKNITHAANDIEGTLAKVNPEVCG